ncbi:MAG: P-type ATPase, partial [Planctomycetota bacterium]
MHTALCGGGFAADYYRLRASDRSAQSAPVQDVDAHERYDYLDTPAYRARYAGAAPAPSKEPAQVTWVIGGITCIACAWLIERLAIARPHIHSAIVDAARGRMTIEFDPGASLANLATELASFGYSVKLRQGEAVHDEGFARSVTHLAVAGAIAANTMLLTLPYYLGLQTGPLAALFGWAAGGLALAALLGPGRVFFRNARLAIRARAVSLDLPLSLGLAAGALGSGVALASQRYDQLYFDSVAVLVFALLLGRFVQERITARAMSAADALEAELPRTVAVLRGNAWVRVAAETLAAGDRIRLEAGDVVPRAGVLVRSGSVDLAVVTGEARTQRLPKGAPVPAGARTLDGGLELIVQPARAKSLAPSASPRLRAVPMLADRLGSGFTITVTLLAIA